MANNNKNPRRTIWLSETEPLSHYDIWLSKNQHLNSDGEPVSTSGVLRDCDYIFKVWDCGDWHPIVGLNSTAVNKIDTVKNAVYTDSLGERHESYEEFHLPLFTNINSSPAELFDAGTLGLAIKKYVTGLEWQNIFGDININDFIELANTEQIGGIKAEQDPNTSDDCRNIPIVLAGQTVGSVWGLDFGTPGRRYLGDSDVLTEYLYLPGWALIEWMKNPYFNQQNPQPFISGWRGTSVRGRSDEEGLWVELDNIALALDGQIPRKKTTDGYISIEWDNLPEIQTYDLLGQDSSESGRYVVKGGSNDKHFLNGDGEWAIPSGNEYSAIYPIGINHSTNEISILPYQGNTRKLYLCSENNNVSWQPVNAGLTYDVLSREDHFDYKLYVINGCGNISPDKVFLNGNGEWAEPYGNTTYTGGIGITVNNENNTHSINIDTEGADEGLVLSYNGNGDVKWITIQSGEEYEAGDGIEIKTPLSGNKIIKAKISECNEEGYSPGFNAASLIEFRALSEGTVMKDVVTLLIDGNDSYGLHPFTYTKISLAEGGDITFKIDGLTRFVDGDPIYVILETEGKPDSYTVSVEDSSGTASNDFISINNALVSNGTSMTFGNTITKYLITMQFGIVKIEPLGYIEANRTEP